MFTQIKVYRFPYYRQCHENCAWGLHFLREAVPELLRVFKPCAAFPDYDAVLTEAGDYTSKFFKLRQLFSMVIGNYQPRDQSTAPPALFHEGIV